MGKERFNGLSENSDTEGCKALSAKDCNEPSAKGGTKEFRKLLEYRDDEGCNGLNGRDGNEEGYGKLFGKNEARDGKPPSGKAKEEDGGSCWSLLPWSGEGDLEEPPLAEGKGSGLLTLPSLEPESPSEPSCTC